jgi:ribosome biogenesis GTPase
VINKADLIDESSEEPVAFWSDLYRDLGYDVLETSVVTGENVEAFGQRLRDRTSVLIGPSGAGKSSLLNAVEPGLDLRIGEVSSRTRKGTHTTTFAALYPLSGGGFVADTPGLREYGLLDLDPEMLCHYFVEMKPFIPDCRYPNCTHDHEPGCRVKEAVDAGQITVERYESYLNMLFSLRLGEKDVGR